MADLLSFFQLLNVLERRKKKDEEEEEEESPRSLLFFLALDEGREGEEDANSWTFLLPLLAAEPRGDRGRWPRLEEEKSFI